MVAELGVDGFCNGVLLGHILLSEFWEMGGYRNSACTSLRAHRTGTIAFRTFASLKVRLCLVLSDTSGPRVERRLADIRR